MEYLLLMLKVQVFEDMQGFFQRKEGDEINIPVSCITDRDVMPECAPAICLDEKYKDKENWPKKNRKWKVESEIKDKEKYIQEIEKKANGQKC